jgi:hypothetical protein
MAMRIMTAPRIRSIDTIREVAEEVATTGGAGRVALMRVLRVLDDDRTKTL